MGADRRTAVPYLTEKGHYREKTGADKKLCPLSRPYIEFGICVFGYFVFVSKTYGVYTLVMEVTYPSSI